MFDYARGAADRGIEVIIAGAAAPPPARHGRRRDAAAGDRGAGAVGRLDGLDSLLSIVQMPAGVPVATVSIAGARNAGLLAVRILGSSDPELRARIVAFQDQLADTVRAKDARCSASIRVKLPRVARRPKMAGWAGNPSFDVFKLPESTMNCGLRSARWRKKRSRRTPPMWMRIRASRRKPGCTEYVRLQRGARAEEYGGQGADSVAACIVIEEVARVDASASLIPAVNKLGTMGLILRGSEDLKKQVLPSIADAPRWPPTP